MRKSLYQLFTINVLIIHMDVALLGVEFANLYIIEATFKGVVYSVKLKLEFAVLGKLVSFVTGNQSRRTRKQFVAFEQGKTPDHEVQEFVDSSRSPSDVTRTTLPSQKKSRGDVSPSDLSLVNFKHVEGHDMTAWNRSIDPEERKYSHYERVEGRDGLASIRTTDPEDQKFSHYEQTA
jgi:hypothetical protein